MKTAILAAFLGLWSVPAIAHSPLQSTTPADAAVLTAAPSEMTLSFKGNIRLTRVTLTHNAGEPQDLSLGEQTAFAQNFVVALSNLGAGDYLITWRGLGDDGHAQTGTFTFKVE